MSFLINATLCALNVALYVGFGYWWNLAAAVLSGTCAVVFAVLDAS